MDTLNHSQKMLASGQARAEKRSMDILTNNQKMLATFIVGFVIGGGSVWLWQMPSIDGLLPFARYGNVLKQEPSDSTGSTALAPSATGLTPNVKIGSGTFSIPVTGEGSVIVAHQPAGIVVVLARVNMPRDGWVAIHEKSSGALGNILGAHRFDAGTMSGTVELLRGTLAGNTYYAVLYSDNGDRAFDPHVDLPMSTANGDMIFASFVAQ